MAWVATSATVRRQFWSCALSSVAIAGDMHNIASRRLRRGGSRQLNVASGGLGPEHTKRLLPGKHRGTCQTGQQAPWLRVLQPTSQLDCVYELLLLRQSSSAHALLAYRTSPQMSLCRQSLATAARCMSVHTECRHGQSHGDAPEMLHFPVTAFRTLAQKLLRHHCRRPVRLMAAGAACPSQTTAVCKRPVRQAHETSYSFRHGQLGMHGTRKRTCH